MAISTAAAILGAAVIGGGASALSSASATKKAANAATYAADQNAQVQREIYNQTRADLAPYAAAGGGALAALSQRLGLTPLTANGAPMPGAQQTNPNAYSTLPGARSGSAAMTVAPNTAPPQGGPGLAARADGSIPRAPTDMQPPGAAPAGQKWVHGPEGWALMADRPAQSVGQTLGGLGNISDLQRNYQARLAAGEFQTPTTGTDPGYATLSAPGAPQTLPASSGAPTSAPAPAPTTGGGTDYAKLFADRPDVKAEYDRLAASADPNSPWYSQHGLDRGAEGFADWWLQNKPAEDTYAAPTVGAPQTPGGGAPDPNAPPPQYYSEQYAARPDAVAIPDFQRPDAPERGAAMQFQDYGSGPQFSWDPSQIANDAGFKFETAETTKGVNAGAAARGKLRSGDAAKALQDRLFGVAHTYGNDYFNRALQGYGANRSAFESNRGYGTDLTKYQQNRTDNIFSEDRAFNDDAFINDRSYGTNLWNTVQNRNDNVFSEDRNFTANRNDQATANLFNLTNVGQNAAAGAANAGQNYANGVMNSNNARASAVGNAALANGQNMSNLFGSAANAIGSYYGSRNGSQGPPKTYNI